MAFSFFASPVAQARLSTCRTSSAQCPTIAPSRAEKASYFFKGKSEFSKSKCTFEFNRSSFSVMAVATPTKSQVPQIATGSLVVADDKTVSPATIAFRQKAEALYRYAQDTVVAGLEKVDGVKFRTDVWKRAEGGGGVTKVLQGGNVFEKAGVNVSVVYGTMPPEAVRAASLTHKAGQSKEDVSFFATGISSVIHPWNPMAPTMHFNYRYFETCSKEGSEPDFWWFGGGIDLTPSYIFNEDVTHFHRTMKDACDKHDPEYYPKFKKWCDEYFLIKHRGERRGLGGIFFDDLNDRSREEIFAFQESCVEGIVPAYAPIVQKRKNLPFNDEQKRWQQLRRGKYAEFNLVYDRGTVFGLKTGGRTESILMSLPLTARWEYDYQPEAGTAEADLLDACRNPREWI